MALRLLAGSKNTRRKKGNNNAKFPVTPHRRSQVMVEQIRKMNNQKLGGTHKAIYEQLQINIQATIINRRSQSLCTSMQ
jgi:hypothetical protein